MHVVSRSYANASLYTVNCVDDDGVTPLHKAVAWDFPECVEELIRAGADVDAADVEGATPLHIAAEKGFVECARALLFTSAPSPEEESRDKRSSDGNKSKSRSRATPDCKDNEGIRPLHRSCFYGHTELT